MTTNTRRITTTCLPWFLSALLMVGCGKKAVPIHQGWSSPIKITESEDSLGGGVVLYKWQNRIIALQPQGDRSAKCFLMNSNDNSWAEVPFTGVPRGYFWYRPATDQNGERVFFEASYVENDQLVISVLVGRLTIDGGLAVRDVTEKKWITNTKVLFGETYSDIRLTERSGTRDWPALGIGIIDGLDLYLPYSLGGFTFGEKGVAIARGPYVNGVFHSADSGATWQIERMSLGGTIVRTKEHFYSFSMKTMHEADQLWLGQKTGIDGSWEDLKVLVPTYANSHSAIAADDTVHLCWLDNRHQKKKMAVSLFPPNLSRKVHNYEVAYCNRKDTDTKWSREMILSKGLLYSYPPTMSVEGDKVVIAWAGIKKADSWHSRFNPNDIYYVISKDAGKTWTTPLKVTDSAKDGITSGDPQVVLLNGVIHLTYIQGKLNLKQEMPGLTKLNQPPWPIYYQAREFPN